MTKASATIALLLVSAGSAFGATADFAFFNTLGLLIALNIVLGGMLAFCALVLASHLWDKVKQSIHRPLQNRRGLQERIQQPNQSRRESSATRSRKTEEPIRANS